MNTNNNLKEYIIKEIQLLPKEIQDVIYNFKWEEILEEIGKNYNLLDKETLALKVETALVFMGLASPRDYPENIQNNIIINNKEILEITKEVTVKIFSPIFKEIEEKLAHLNLPEKEIAMEKENWEHNIDYILTGEN